MLPCVTAAGVTKLPSVFAVPVLSAASPAALVYLVTTFIRALQSKIARAHGIE